MMSATQSVRRSGPFWLVLLFALVCLQLGLIAHEIEHGLQDDDVACVKCLSSAHLGHGLAASPSPLPPRDVSTDDFAAGGVLFFPFSNRLRAIRAPPLPA